VRGSPGLEAGFGNARFRVTFDIFPVGQPRPIYHQFQTYRCTAPTEAMGQDQTSPSNARKFAGLASRAILSTERTRWGLSAVRFDEESKTLYVVFYFLANV
jgi:hypothetical protein